MAATPTSLPMAEYNSSSSTDSRRPSKSGLYTNSKSKEDGPPRPRSSHSDPPEDLLEAMGYTQQLARSRSTWSVTFMSFVLASVPYGLSTTLIYPLTNGGHATIIWGWIAVCLLMICVAASLGEITSVRPSPCVWFWWSCWSRSSRDLLCHYLIAHPFLRV